MAIGKITVRAATLEEAYDQYVAEARKMLGGRPFWTTGIDAVAVTLDVSLGSPSVAVVGWDVTYRFSWGGEL